MPWPRNRTDHVDSGKIIASDASVICIRCNKKTLIGKCRNCGNDLCTEVVAFTARPDNPWGIDGTGHILDCTVCHKTVSKTWVCECGCENRYHDTFAPEFVKVVSDSLGIYKSGFQRGCFLKILIAVALVYGGFWVMVFGVPAVLHSLLK